MQDFKYCYPNTEVLINKLGIKNAQKLFDAEKKMTALRMYELQKNPIDGNFDFNHLKKIHKYIFQDVYEWAGEIRTVEIGKGNLFCTTPYIEEYAASIFSKYYSQCFSAKKNKNEFVNAFASNYGDLNALHPFREGNGRAQREFARQLCSECGYDFTLANTTHKEMLQASILSFNKGDNSLFVKIFDNAIFKQNAQETDIDNALFTLTSDDMIIGRPEAYDHYTYEMHENAKVYDAIYQAKIQKMDAEKKILDAQNLLRKDKLDRKHNQAQGFSR